MMKQSGFVLLMVLIVISVMSIIGMYTLTLSQREQRVSQQTLLTYQREIKHTGLLANIEKSLLASLPVCMVDPQSVSQIANWSLGYWELNGCFEQLLSLRYIYVVEDFGIDNCAVISTSNEIAHYYRINLLVKQTPHGARSAILQSVMIKPDIRQQPCQSQEHTVTVGRQGMRWISSKGMTNETIHA